METFSVLLAICAVNSPHRGQWREALMFSLICAWISGWVNDREAGDLRRHRAHYDAIVMVLVSSMQSKDKMNKIPLEKWDQRRYYINSIDEQYTIRYLERICVTLPIWGRWLLRWSHCHQLTHILSLSESSRYTPNECEELNLHTCNHCIYFIDI